MRRRTASAVLRAIFPSRSPEDLSSFVGGERWGVSLEDVLARIASENLERRGLNPALRKMGFLGLMEAGDATAVLLADPEVDGGGIVQLAPGDTLPDGRVLTSVTDNSITLTGSSEGADGEGTHQEVLLLFPRAEPLRATGRELLSRLENRWRRRVRAHLASDAAKRQIGGRKVLRITYSPFCTALEAT